MFRYKDVMKRVFLTVVIMALGVAVCRAQYDAVFSNYWALEPSYNPAAVGKEAKINVAAAYNMSLVGFEHSPKTMYAGGDMAFKALKAIHGVGAHFINDEIGLFSHKLIAVQYAGRLRLFGGALGIGVQAGMLSEQFDGGKVDTGTPNDPAFPKGQTNGTAFDLGTGLYYNHGSWYAGVSVQHLTSPTVELGETQSFDVTPHYYVTGGCHIKLRNPYYTIHPSVLGRYDGTAYRVDMTCRAKYTYEQKMFYGGLGYSPGNSVSLLLGGNFKGVNLGYCYEVYTSALSLGNGGHELMMSYQVEVDLGKRGRNKHKSVRFL